MPRHYFTLLKICEELRELTGLQVAECFTQEKDTLVISFGNENIKHLFFSADTKFPCIFIRDKFSRARMNTLDLLPSIIGDYLQDAGIVEGNRLIKLTFVHTIAYAVLFGGAKSNFYVCDSENRIIDSLNETAKNRGNLFEIPRPGSINFTESQKISKLISGPPLNLGKVYAIPFMEKFGIDHSALIDKMTGKEVERIIKAAGEFKADCLKSDDFGIYSDNNKLFISLIDQGNLYQPAGRYDSASKAVQRWYAMSRAGAEFRPEKQKLEKIIERFIKKAEGNLKAAENREISLERERKYREYGTMLLAMPNPREMPGDLIEAKDEESNIIKIPTNSKKTIIENGEEYFRKAKNTKRESELLEERIPGIEIKLNIANTILNNLNEAGTLKDLEKVKKRISVELGIKMENEEQRPENKFRQFELEEGYILYVGKNAANNDELTIRFAKPNDIWLHARGSGGSHCVLRGPGKDKPPKHVIKAAAAIAAYYSQARNAGYTPVAWTYKKYVRKPKGANTGSVTISREDVIMVEPGLP